MENLPEIIISSTAVIVAALVGAIASALYSGGKTYKTTKISKAELSTEHAGLSKELSKEHGDLSKEHGDLSKEHATLLGQYAMLSKGQETIAAATGFLHSEALEAKGARGSARGGTLDAITIMEKLGSISAELIALQKENDELRTENLELRQAMQTLQTEYQKLEERCQELETEQTQENDQEEWER